MSKIRPRAIFIGKPEVGDALAKMRKDWDFVPSVLDIESFWEGLDSGEIDNNIHIILVLDQLFDPSGEDNSFENLLVTMSPHCFFGVINYNPDLRRGIKERVDYEAYNTGNSGIPLYFYINPKTPNKSFQTSIEEFISKSSATDAVTAIAGREVEEASVTAVEEAPRGSVLGEVSQDSEYLGKIVACTSSKGGAGKSTIAIGLATYLAHASEASALKGYEPRPLKVIVVDLDVRDGQVGFVTGNTKPTVIALRLNGISEQTLDETIISSPRLKVDLLLAPKRPRNSDDTPPDFYIELLEALRKRYDYIILDTSVNYLDPLLEKVAYPAADNIIFVTDIVVSSVFSMTRWIQEVTKTKAQDGFGINRNKIGVVVNKTIPDVNMSTQKIKRAVLGLPILSPVPSNQKLVAYATNMQSLELLLRHQGIRSALGRIARALVGSNYKLSDDF